jgi:uncharacterized membrane protein
MQVSKVSNMPIPLNQEVLAKTIRAEVFDAIKSEIPEFTPDCYISKSELAFFRQKCLDSLFSEVERELCSWNKSEHRPESNQRKKPGLESKGPNASKVTFGERTADYVASFGGSWTFILAFFSFILIWIAANIWLFSAAVFDPFPFILLNLILSCLAAIQAPIIMMSQNRQEKKDRKRAEQDLKINLKAELEIKIINRKVDAILNIQQSSWRTIQQINFDVLEDLMAEVKSRNKGD